MSPRRNLMLHFIIRTACPKMNKNKNKNKPTVLHINYLILPI